MCEADASPRIFQPTHPAGGATGDAVQVYLYQAISTHAPRGGCDKTLSLLRML